MCIFYKLPKRKQINMKPVKHKQGNQDMLHEENMEIKLEWRN